MADKYDLFKTVFGLHLLRNYPSLPRGEAGRDLIRSIADAILEMCGAPPGAYDNFESLGEGAYAKVFWCKHDRKKVLKITSDMDDAEACAVLKKKPDKDLLQVYEVARLAPRQFVFAILVEKLTPLSSSETKIWNDARGAWESMSISIREVGLGQDFLEDLDSAMEDAQAAGYKNWADDIRRVLPTLQLWVKKLAQQRGIIWKDLHTGNIMMRGHREIISDLGRAQVMGAPTIPVLDY